MKPAVLLGVLAGVLSLPLAAGAIDRDAAVIHSIGIGASTFDEGDSLDVTIWEEAATAAPRRNVAFLFGGGAGRASLDDGGDMDYWGLGLGLKFYLSKLFSVYGLGSYRSYEGGDMDWIAGTAGAKYRFLKADEPVSPFVACDVTFRSVEGAAEADAEEDSSQVVGAFTAGCDFMMNDELAFVLEAGYFGGDRTSSDGPDPWQGWTAMFSMKYYWDR